MEYSASPTADATAPVSPATMQPTTVEDLERRLVVLKTAGVREYQDGGLHILFERPQQRHEEENPIERLVRRMEEERVAHGG